MSAFEPELGQAVFSNTPWQGIESPHYIEAGLVLLGAIVADGQYDRDPTNNVGPDANFDNDTFTMRAYCWCDGEREGHHDGCPPNFVCGDFAVCWYKHGGRSLSQNRKITPVEWGQIVARCLASLTSPTEGGSDAA